MDRRARLTPALAFIVALVAAPPPGSAQGLARLHVTALSLSSDRTRVAVRQPFHVVIHLHVAERIAEPQNLFLPDLTNCEIDGTERTTAATATGTDYREVLTLEAQAPGRAHLSPARLLAIDARNGMPSQFASNDLTIIVGGSTTNTLRSVERVVRQALQFMLGAAALALLVLVGIVVAVLAVRRRSAEPVVPVSAVAPQPARPRRLAEELRDALIHLDDERTPIAALRVRRALFTIAGATPDATLRDALGTIGDGDPALRSAVVAAERAAFQDGPYRPAAIDELLRTATAIASRLERDV